MLALTVAGCFGQPPRPQGVPGDGRAADGNGDGAARGDADPTAGHNVVFVSSGVFKQFPLQQGADASFCSTAAHNAGLLGNYIGWLSDPADGNAADRLAAMPLPGDWVRPDGKPFAATVYDVVTGNIANPPVIDEDGHDATVAEPTVSVATGTLANGMIDGSGAGCGSGSIAIGKPASAPGGAWTDYGEVNCSQTNLRLYCFSFGR